MFNSTVLFYLVSFTIIISVVAAKSQNNDNTPQAKIAPRNIQQFFANQRRLKYFPHNNNANNNRNNDNNNNNNYNIAPSPLQEIYFPGSSNETGTVSHPPVLGNSGPASQHHIKRKQLSSSTATSVETIDTDDKEYQLFLNKQAKNAQYSFDSNVEDTINDLTNTRQEERNGLALTGMYSYSDGFFKRTVHYKADEQGYRVIKEELIPIGDGPKYNPNGQADVSSSLTGHYSVTADDYNRDYYNKFKQ